MGFFDNLLKRGANRVLSNLVNDAADKLTDKIEDKITERTDTTTTVNSSPKPAASNSSSAVDTIRNVLRTDFSMYEVKENISPTTIGGTGKFVPYTFGLYESGQPKAFIMVTDHNKEQLRTFRWSKEEAEKNGIPFINFFTQFPNKMEYVKNRLAQNIK